MGAGGGFFGLEACVNVGSTESAEGLLCKFRFSDLERVASTGGFFGLAAGIEVGSTASGAGLLCKLRFSDLARVASTGFIALQ